MTIFLFNIEIDKSLSYFSSSLFDYFWVEIEKYEIEEILI